MTTPDFEVIPEPLRALARTHWERFVAAGASETLQAALLDADAIRVFASSDFVAESAIKSPQLFDVVTVDQLTSPLSDKDIPTHVRQTLNDVSNESELHIALRTVRRQEMLRIAWRDLAGWATLDETLGDLSRLADACVQTALEKLAGWLTDEVGVVRDASGQPQSLVVLGLGKLGAHELNFSSDIDLVFAYPERGDSDGAKSLASDDWFTRLGRKLIHALNEPTADGFVFRVDMRLRPFGASGPLVASFAGMEGYYESYGRDWERYALIKARPVAGDLEAGEQLLRSLRPFIYRRYLDFNAFESLREMKAMIAQEVARQGLDDNIKLGRGGIREIEFIGQVFQLIRGGREAVFRERGIRLVLRALAAEGYLDSQDMRALDKAYVFLRKAENRLQMVADRQTHELPSSPTAQLRLAWSMGFDDWAAFHAALSLHRDKVRAVFDAVFAAPEDESTARDDVHAVWQAVLSGNDIDQATAALGFSTAGAAALRDLHSASSIRTLGARGQRSLDQLMPHLIQAAAASTKPDSTLISLLQLIEAVAGRTAYLALLAENDNVLHHLATIAEISPWLLQRVTRVPLLMDELIDPRLFQSAPEPDRLAAELETMLASVPAHDQEAEMDSLRQFQQAAVLRIAAADLSGNADESLVSRRLTALAEVVLQSVLTLTCDRLVKRHGVPAGHAENDRSQVDFLVIAYGTLGSGELGYGSDLDLVFMHDGVDESSATVGPNPIAGGVFYARWTQRMISFLSTVTSAGALYQVDTRLRPSGSAGLLVGSFEGFARYQHDHAWTWEHQALIRARPVAGDVVMANRFNDLRRDILCQERDDAALRKDVASMRERMRGKLGVETKEGFDIKQGAGGLLDIQFLIQYWVLRSAHQYPALCDSRNHLELLAQLAEVGVVESAFADELSAAYLQYRRRMHRLTLEGWGGIVPDNECLDARAAVTALWRDVFGSALS